jgi:pyridoxine 4-dehydrogenase
VERIELLQLHRVDPETPLTDQLGTLRELQVTGKVGRIGLSEVSVDQLDRAREIVEVGSVQNRYNLLDREHEPVLRACTKRVSGSCPGGRWARRRPVARRSPRSRPNSAPPPLKWRWLARSPVILPIPGPAGSRTWKRTSPWPSSG